MKRKKLKENAYGKRKMFYKHKYKHNELNINKAKTQHKIEVDIYELDRYEVDIIQNK